jgi:threonine dehydrogenase-like Zn-dependent dehydrogenase
VSVVNRRDPTVGIGEILVAPAYVGLCGSDLELFDGSHPYFVQGRAVLPLQPGHEVSAIVVEDRSGALPTGTRVVLDPVVGCRLCPQCLDGRATHCADRFELGLRRGMDGGAAELISVPCTNAHPVPEGVSLREAVLTEPGVTALNGLRRIGELAGRALVIGAGTLGGIATQLLVASGVEVEVLVLDERRGPLIERWGARPTTAPADGAYDVVIEAAGTAEAVRSALRTVAPGGSIALLGVQGQPLDGFDVDAILFKDASIFGVLNGPGLYESMLDEIATGHVRARELIEREFALEDAAAAFEFLASQDRMRPKVLLRVGDIETSL